MSSLSRYSTTGNPAATLAWNPLLRGELLESDTLYFELTAETRQLSGGLLVWAPGFVSIPSGCVILRVRQAGTLVEACSWVQEFEEASREVGERLCRLYVQHSTPILEAALNEAGYESRAEAAFLTPPCQVPPSTPVTLRQINTNSEWEMKCRIDAESSVGPDGYSPDPRLWNEWLRMRWKTGKLCFYFIELRGDICGTVGAMPMNNLLRLKNITVRPTFRNKGVGRGAVLALWQKSFDTGKDALGVFAIEGEAGFAMYGSAGLSVAGRQFEWTKTL